MSKSRAKLALAGALFAVAILVSVVRFGGPSYTLEDPYSDHLRHQYTAWSLLQVGIDVWRVPLGEWNVTSRDPFSGDWDDLPHAYPPVSTLLFLPFGLFANLLPWKFLAHAAMPIVFGVAGGAAAVLLWKTLGAARYPPVLAAVLTALAAPGLVYWGLNGFFDTVVVAAALAGILAFHRGRVGPALVATGIALGLHYRVWYLVPLFGLLLYRHRRVDAASLTAGAIVVASLATLLLLLPTWGLMTEALPAFQPNPAHAGGIGGLIVAALLTGVILIGLARESLSTVASGVLGLGLVLFSVQWQAWYPLAFLPLLPLVTSRRAQFVAAVGWVQIALIVPGSLEFLGMAQRYLTNVR